jgi:hypothetical protein
MDTVELAVDLLLSITENTIFDGRILTTAIIDFAYLPYFRQQRLEKHHSGSPPLLHPDFSQRHPCTPAGPQLLTPDHPGPLRTSALRAATLTPPKWDEISPPNSTPTPPPPDVA